MSNVCLVSLYGNVKYGYRNTERRAQKIKLKRKAYQKIKEEKKMLS